MNFAEDIKNSWQIMRRNKVRSFLTMLGIIIGIMSVIIIISAGSGAQSLILNQIKSMGSNLIAVLPGKSDSKGPPASVMGVLITTLKNEDGQAVMRERNPHILDYTSYVRGAETVTYGDKNVDTTFIGVGAGLVNVEDIKISTGRFFTEEEDKSISAVAVIGYQTAQDLFGDEDPIGKQLKIKKTNFTIIGMTAKRGTAGMQNQDNQIYVPLETAQKLLLGINYVSYMRFKIDEDAYVDDSMNFVTDILRQQHDITNPEDDDFSVRSMAQSLSTISTITNALKFFLAAVAAISLIVGGIGIMNIMLAAVQERTREIGLRKAIGARNRQIVEQFLIETATITFVAGIIGIISGVLISYAVARLAQSAGYQWDFVISIWSIILGCVVSVGIGLIFGIIPARRASKLDPIEALRYE